MMKHSFCKEIADEVGVPAALILNHFDFWITENKKAGRNEFDGRTWTYVTGKELAEIFSYLSRYQILEAIKKLKNAGLIVTGCYNKINIDRTIWYSTTKRAVDILEKSTLNHEDTAIVRKLDIPLSENRQCIVRKPTMDCLKTDNALSENRQPIPDNNHIYNQIYNTDGKKRKKKVHIKDLPPDFCDSPEKIQYAKYVFLTEKEYRSLEAKYGTQMTDELIDILNNYKDQVQHGYYSDVGAIRNWCIDKYRTRHRHDQNLADIAAQAEMMKGGNALENNDAGGDIDIISVQGTSDTAESMLICDNAGKAVFTTAD